MTHQFNGRGFNQIVEPAFRSPFEGRSQRHDYLVNSLMARRYARRARRDNRAI